MIEDDRIALRVLAFLGDRYQPVLSDWVEAGAIAAALHLPEDAVVARCQALLAAGLIELSPPDDENDSYAALITARGLLAIGRTP